MWRIGIAAALMAFPIACANANDALFDSSDPVHCMVIFGIAANGAKQVSNAATAESMFQRASFLAEQQGGRRWIDEIMPKSLEIGAKMEAAHDERATIRLLDACVAKQDADPAFRKWMQTR